MSVASDSETEDMELGAAFSGTDSPPIDMIQSFLMPGANTPFTSFINITGITIAVTLDVRRNNITETFRACGGMCVCV